MVSCRSEIIKVVAAGKEFITVGLLGMIYIRVLVWICFLRVFLVVVIFNTCAFLTSSGSESRVL